MAKEKKDNKEFLRNKEVINISNPCSKVKDLVLKLQKLPII